MRKYIVFGIVMACLIGILIYIYLPEENNNEIFVILESHYLLYDENQTVGIKYFSQTKDIIKDTDIKGGFIYNQDASIKFQIEDLSIKKIHDERYMDVLHFGYELHFKLPDITATYHMEQLYMKIKIKDTNYEFFLGSLFVEYPQPNDNFIGWYGIEGIKGQGPQLFQILVDVEVLTLLDEIYVGPFDADYFTGEQNIVIKIPPHDYVFSDTFVKIISQEGITYLPNFTYFINYELLESGLHHNYIIM